MAEELIEARESNLSFEKFLLNLLEKEYDMRESNGVLNRIRIAGFPAKKHIEDLETEYLPVDCQNKLKILTSLDFVKNGRM